ncbi:MAG TPA: hypothetical protein VFB26_04030 [Gaiellaceae bacterium]|nr:hypothetical protein [Gaiellaceae bacterium]
MRLVPCDPASALELDGFGNRGSRPAPLARSRGCRVACGHLEAGGRNGRHAAGGQRRLAIVAGKGEVSGAGALPHPVGFGVAAVREPGEQPETRSASGLTAIVVELVDVDVLAVE